MNFDRNYQTQIAQNDKSTDFIDKIQKLPIVKKVYLYIFLMTVVGAAMGGVKYRLESVNCLAQSDCWTVETTQRRAREIGLGAIAGMFAATSISIPALLKDN
jgi:hypothetical protein